MKKFLALSLSDVVFIMLINIKCWHFNIYEQDKFLTHLIELGKEKKFYNIGAWLNDFNYFLAVCVCLHFV